jgi:hypothetical protein
MGEMRRKRPLDRHGYIGSTRPKTALKRSRWFVGEQKNIICRQQLMAGSTIGPLDAEG